MMEAAQTSSAVGATIPYPLAVSIVSFVLLTGVLTAALVYLSRTTAHVVPLDPYIRPILAVLITLAFICCTLLMMSRLVPDNEGSGLLLGGLLAAFSNIVTHYFNAAKKPPVIGPPDAPQGPPQGRPGGKGPDNP